MEVSCFTSELTHAPILGVRQTNFLLFTCPCCLVTDIFMISDAQLDPLIQSSLTFFGRVKRRLKPLSSTTATCLRQILEKKSPRKHLNPKMRVPALDYTGGASYYHSYPHFTFKQRVILTHRLSSLRSSLNPRLKCVKVCVIVTLATCLSRSNKSALVAAHVC